MQKAKMAGLKLLRLLAGAATVSALIAAPVESHSQHRLSLTSPAPPSQQFQCELAPVLDPSGDGLPSAHDLFSSKAAIERQVKRHQAIVRVPSVSYDDLGPLDEDERWKPFYELHRVLEETYPITHARAKLEKINTFGLLYTIQGSDESLQPIILMAHQDVVPVADASTWTHPPFEAVYDGTWIWGRGASDDKNCLTGIMSAVEALLSNKDWTPRRTTLLAFGFDEENSGYLGAGRIAQTILSRYGPDSVAVIVDEGGLNVQTVGDAEFALPAVTEKGYVDVWMELDVAGGHSSKPFPHTGIGIVSEMVSALEAHPYEARVVEDGPVHRHLQCQARYSPDTDRELTRLIRENDLAGVARHLVSLGRDKQYTIQTSQAVDFISGGQKINAMPEQIKVGVNYRVAHHDSIVEVQHNVVKYIAGVVEKYGLAVKAFEDDADYQEYAAGMSPLSSPFSSSDVDYKGTIVLSTQKKSYPAAISPTSGPVWDVFSGTIQHSFGAGNSTVVPIGEIMTGNTDTRHYHELSKHIYRFAPYRYSFEDNIHTVDEHVRVSGHMEGVRFYYDFIRNFDAAKL